MLRRLLITLVLSSTMLWAPAVPASAPADSMIRSAVADLKRYEAQAARLTPARKASAKRILKLLEITAGRLEKSRNKDHPSWKAADERLAALRQDLRKLIGEKNGTTSGGKQAQVLAQQIERALGRARLRMSKKLALANIDIVQARRGLDRLKTLDPDHRSIADFERRYESLAPQIAKKTLAWAQDSFAKQRAEIDRTRATGHRRQAKTRLDRLEAGVKKLDPLIDLTGPEGVAFMDEAAAYIAEARTALSAGKETQVAVTRSAPPKASKPDSKAAPTAAAKPAGRDAEIAALQKQIDALARGQQGGRDTALPLIKAEAPKEVPIGEEARIVGVVGDDGSPPRLKVNGKPATLFRLGAGEAPIAKHSLAFRIDVPSEAEGRQRFVLEACDAAGNCVGDEVVVRVGGLNRPNIEGRNFALVIGNNAYRDLPQLKTARNDAKALASLLVERYDFEQENVQLLLDADRNTILGAIEGLRSELDVDDRLVIYYAGHGQIDQSTGEGFWQPVDAAADKTFTWIANDDVRRQLKGLPAKHVLVIADSCFSGSLTRSAPANRPIPEDRYFTEIDSHWSRKVISSGGTEPVADSGSGGHSVFAHYLLKTLGQNERPYITSSELFGRFVRAVTNNSDQKPEFGTISKAGDEGGGDFTFILREGG